MIPTSVFNGLQYVVLYSEFGSGPINGGFAAEGSFEEWDGVVKAAVVPEPTTMIAGALLLLPFGATALGALRRRRST